MSNLGSPISPTPPSSPSMSRRKAPWARRIERCCCSALVYTPLAFVYGLTTWAAFVEVNIGFQEKKASWTGRWSSLLGLTLYGLLNWSYTVAVFKDPGSPLDSKKGYSHLPTNEPLSTSFTVKSTGKSRFCKKCQARKPDRAHHCSSCRRCVLKMDHHCPWLATCLGLRNYKAFVLFLTYTTVFCWICFAVSASWVWTQVLSDGQYADTLMPVNYILLTVISGIIGLVLTGFTGWHLTLACRGQTTIECLEQTRYLSPLRKSIQQKPIPRSPLDGKPQQTYGQQLREIHANIIPGITRLEEGEERPSPVEDASRSPAQNALRTNYDELERMRERERYEDYLDERDSDKLPHAFDLGIKENLYHLFGPSPLLWCLPICNTSGDGWTWKPSPKWMAAREQIRRDREQQWHDDRVDQRNETMIGAERHYLSADGASGAGGRRSPYKADRVLGRNPGQYTDYDSGRTKRPQSGVSMHTLHHEYDDDDHFEVSSDEDPDQENNPQLNEGGGWRHQYKVGPDREQSQRLLREREQRSGNGWEEWTRET